MHFPAVGISGIPANCRALTWLKQLLYKIPFTYPLFKLPTVHMSDIKLTMPIAQLEDAK